MNKLTAEIINKIQTVDDERVIDFIDDITTDIKNRKIKVTEYLKVMLSMLVTQFVLYVKAVDQINKESSVSSTDDYKRAAKSPAIAVAQKAHDKIVELLDRISLSPLSEAKIKKLNSSEEESAQEILNELVN